MIEDRTASGFSLKVADTCVGAVVTVAPFAGSDETSSA
jgi:hypothetical protein